jgi:hypothetical protein
MNIKVYTCVLILGVSFILFALLIPLPIGPRSDAARLVAFMTGVFLIISPIFEPYEEKEEQEPEVKKKEE